MSKVQQYKIMCLTEGKYVYLWDTEPPQRCSHYAHHSVDASSVEVIPNSDVEFYRAFYEGIMSSPKFKLEGMIMPIPPIAEFYVDVEWPIPISLYSTDFDAKVDHDGDEMSVYILPNSVFASVVETIQVGDTVIPIPDDSDMYLNVGYILRAIDMSGNVVNDFGYITKIDKTANTVTVENAATTQIVAADCCKLAMTIEAVKSLSIGSPRYYSVGRANTEGVYIPANTSCRLKYVNNNLQSKQLKCYFQLLY